MSEATLSGEDLGLVERLRAGDETAFMQLVEQLQPQMLRVARMYVATASVAEEVVQEAWLGVLRGIERFEGRSSLRTWIFRILVNTAKTRGQREGRSMPFSTLAGDDLDAPSVEAAWFQGPEGAHPNQWSSIPRDWRGLPEERLLSNETLAIVRRAVDELPPIQAAVIRMRDVLGLSSDEVRNALDLTETNQRVLLHRARSRVRRALEDYVENVG